MCAIEDLASSLEEKASGTLLLLVIIAALAAIAVLGDRVYLGIVDTNLDPFSQWRAVLICGLVGGLAGGLFSRLLYAGSHAARRDVRQPRSEARRVGKGGVSTVRCRG